MRLLAGALHAGRRGRDRDGEAAIAAELERTGRVATARRLGAWSATGGAARFGAAAAWLCAMREG